MKARVLVDFLEIMLEPDDEIDAKQLEKLFGALRELRRQVDKQ